MKNRLTRLAARFVRWAFYVVDAAAVVEPRVPLPASVTAEWLAGLGACRASVDDFREKFPDGLPPTKTSLLRAADAGCSVAWLARRLLPAAEFDGWVAVASSAARAAANDVVDAVCKADWPDADARLAVLRRCWDASDRAVARVVAMTLGARLGLPW